MRISDWSSDVCSSDLGSQQQGAGNRLGVGHHSVSPRRRASIPSHRACSSRAWTSWMRMVRSWGTHKWTSCAVRSSLTTPPPRSEEHTSELQSLMRISYDVFCLKKKIIESYSKE